ncbi:MAG TPA: glycosyltransferase, partial [Puia sp.]
MHYGIVAIGSRGDVQPYIALALGLKERGEEVTLMAHQNFKTLVEGFGLSFIPISGDVEAMLHTAEGMKMVRSGSLAAFTRYLNKVTRQTSVTVSRDILMGCRQADVLIASLLAIAWVDAIAEKLGKKWAIVQLNLPALRTKAFPLAPLAFFDFPSYNRFSYRLF